MAELILQGIPSTPFGRYVLPQKCLPCPRTPVYDLSGLYRTIENSPALQRWEGWPQKLKSPRGRQTSAARFGVCRKKVIDSDQRISKLASMSKTFRAYDMNQQLLLPPDLRQWLRDDHLALYVSDVVEGLDLSRILNVYEEGDSRGRPPYHPALMVKLLVYGYCTGRMSSRKLEQATYDEVAFRVLSCDQHPDHDS